MHVTLYLNNDIKYHVYIEYEAIKLQANMLNVKLCYVIVINT